MTMEILQYILLCVPLVCSLMSDVTGQCSGSAQTLSVGYSAITVTPPGYPNGYAPNQNCIWVVTTSINGKSTLFRVTDITLNCAGDAINVYDGTSTAGTQVHTNECASGSSARTLPYEVAASGNIYLVFTSDASSSASEKGFKTYIISADDFSGSGCSAAQSLTATSTEQYLSSPSFPSAYALNQNCEWTITTSSSNANVYIQIKFLDVEYVADCTYDYLDITESGSSIVKLCRDDDWEPTETYTSTGSSFTLSFRSDGYTASKRGFLLSYKEIDGTSAASKSDESTRLSSGEITAISLGVSAAVFLGVGLVYHFGVKPKSNAIIDKPQQKVADQTNNNNKTNEVYDTRFIYAYPEKEQIVHKLFFKDSFHDIIRERDYYN